MNLLSREFFERWLWLCPLAGILLAAAVLLYFGLSLWSAMLAALFLICPALIAWGAWRAWSDRRPQ